jgi:hypothetical protein
LGNGCVGVGSTDEAREAVRQVRVFATGNGRKSDPVDAHSVAMAALHTPNLLRVEVDDDLVVMGCWWTGVTSSAGPAPRR